MNHCFDGASLSVEKVSALAAAPCRCDLTSEAWQRIAQGRAIVERMISSGAAIYGVTTGVGSQKDVTVGEAKLEGFGNRMIVSEATDFPGAAFPERTVRAALIVLINNFASGRSGVRPELVRALLELLAGPRLPEVRRDSSFGVADLTPLSQLALALIGRSVRGTAPTADQALSLAPKESLSLIASNSFALGEAALVMRDAERLLQAFDVAAATACEGFRADLEPFAEASAGGGSRGEGLTRARLTLLGLLAGSQLNEPNAARFLQDPLSFRGITQIHGAAYEAWAWAKTQAEREINSTSDNPLVDFETGRLLTSASMISALPTLSLDCLRQALAKVAIQSQERSLKLQSPPFSGLPVGLSREGEADGGVLSINLNYVAAARLGTLGAAAAPVLLQYIGSLADGVEDVTTLLPLSVAQTATVVDRAWEIAALEMTIAVWAIARRELARASLGRGPRVVFDALLPLLHIGEEGTRVFDMRAIAERVRSGGLVEAALREQ
jgi:histidine ammonia-lyase